ncbi:MAG: diguanylate cyclase [Dehalococcoidia bacterium]
MKRLVYPLNRFPGEAFALAVGGTILLALFAGPWAGFGLCAALALVQAGLVRAAFASRDEALERAATVEEHDGLLKTELNKIRSRMPYEDHETGVGTRRQLELSWTKQLARHRRWGEPFAIALLEVTDAFRKERLLGPGTAASVASALLEVARTEDVICRLDNHTFAVLLAGTGKEGADRFVDRARVRTSGEPHDGDDGEEFYLTVVGGTAEWDDAMQTVVDMLAVADHALGAFREDHQQQLRQFGGRQLKAS